VSISGPPSDDLNIERGEIVFDLPPMLAREIGLVIAAHANLEHRLNILLYTALGLPSVYGRLAVREPRVAERFDLVLEVLRLRECPIDEEEASDLRAAIEEAGAQRDHLAHGIWIRSAKGALHLRLIRGAWQPVQNQRGKTKRAILPEANPYTISECRSLRRLLHLTLTRLEEFGSSIAETLLSLPDIHDPQSRLVDRIRDRTRGKPARPP
jgi:hypothetical protein